MTMPKGFAPVNFCTCGHVETSHTKQLRVNSRGKPMPTKGMKREEELEEYNIITSNNACNQCDCSFFIDKEVVRIQELERGLKQQQRYNSRGSIGSGGGSGGGSGLVILIGCFVVGVILLIVTVFTLNFYVLALGGILFLIGVAGLSWGSRGTHNNTSGLFWYTYGSHNAKKNMYRGHRYSKRK